MRDLAPNSSTTREMLNAIRQLIQGRNNATGEVTLTQNAATTVVSNPTINSGSVPVLVPLTANAAAELGNGTLYVSSIVAGSFTITHANNAQSDRDYRYLRLGG